jgi:putative zinc finger protein
MRHIPEDELHAYLDQGLSRSQCVEIESHLAACASCQANRDGIAALRDRTTALLAKLAPPRSFPTSFESLRSRAAVHVSARRRRVHLAAWAASVVAAVALGWTASLLMAPRSGPVATAPSTGPIVLPVAVTQHTRPTTAPAILRAKREDSSAVRTPRPTQFTRRSAAPAALASLPPVIPAPTLELSSVDISGASEELELDGMWRTMSWDGAQAEAGDKLPHIDGLPVVQVQVQANQQGQEPLMVVAQQLSSGEVIRTIEGPATDVSQLLSRRAMSEPAPTVPASDSSRRGTLASFEPSDRTMAMQRGDRMIAITGALPPDSLLAMIRRLNAEMRSK